MAPPRASPANPFCGLAFYNEATPSVGQGRATDVIYLDIVPHTIAFSKFKRVYLMGQLHPKDSAQWLGVPVNFSGVPWGQ